MIASCWDWPSLKYVYYVLDRPLDAGGWSPTKGIARSESASGGDVVTLESCLPPLPSEAYFAGVGDFCVGELYEKRDAADRPSIDLQKMRQSGSPHEVKAAELLLDGQTGDSAPGAMRKNPHHPHIKDHIGNLYPSERTIWEKLLPTMISVTSGYFAYKAFQGLTKENLALRDVVFAWGAGVAVGLTIGQEATRQGILRETTGE